MEPRQARILKAHGVRGSFPVADRSYMEYGGNTSCYSIEYPNRVLVFDAGTGIGQVPWDKKPIHVFLSHLHMDHVMGLFCWPVLFCPEAKVHFYGEGKDENDLKQKLGNLFAEEFWPVNLSSAAAELSFHPFAPGEEICFQEEDGAGCRISAMRSQHPGCCMMFRLEEGDHSLVYMLDYELGQADGEVQKELEAFIHKADYMIFDAQYTLEELPAHIGWGHSSWEQGAELGMRAGIGHVLMAHYDRGHDDCFLMEQEKKVLERYGNSIFMREKNEYWLW